MLHMHAYGTSIHVCGSRMRADLDDACMTFLSTNCARRWTKTRAGSEVPCPLCKAAAKRSDIREAVDAPPVPAAANPANGAAASPIASSANDARSPENTSRSSSNRRAAGVNGTGGAANGAVLDDTLLPTHGLALASSEVLLPPGCVGDAALEAEGSDATQFQSTLRTSGGQFGTKVTAVVRGILKIVRYVRCLCKIVEQSLILLTRASCGWQARSIGKDPGLFAMDINVANRAQSIARRRRYAVSPGNAKHHVVCAAALAVILATNAHAHQRKDLRVCSEGFFG